MSANNKIKLVIGIAILCLIVCVIWDLGTPDPVGGITINPFFTDWSLSNIDINAIIQSILSALIGFFLSIYIIEYVINKAREEEEKKEEARKEAEKEWKKEIRLKAIMNLLKFPMDEYSRAARIITNKKKRESVIKTYMAGDYSLKIPIGNDALLDIYSFVPYGDLGRQTKKIKFYMETVENLHTTIKSILLNADLSDYPDLTKAFLDYINKTYRYYEYSKNLSVNSCYEIKNNLETVRDVLDKHVVDLDIPQDSIAYPFVALAKLLELHDEFFKKILTADDYKILFIDKYM